MSTLVQYFERTVKGMETFFSHDKMPVILLAVLLLLWLSNKKKINGESNRLLVYSAGISCALLFPVTAVIAVIYQSAYYDYEWVWSMVPAVSVIAYGGVQLYEKKEKEKNGKVFWWMAVLVLLFLCGNQGCLQTASEEAISSETLKKTIAAIESEPELAEPVLWGPSHIMQEIRCETGEIVLVYGKDMWDPKSGAYDYEAYSEELIQAYEWMDSISVLEVSEGQGIWELYDKYDIYEKLPEAFAAVLNAGANVIVLPERAAGHLEEMILQEAEKVSKSVQKEYVEQYAIYLLK